MQDVFYLTLTILREPWWNGYVNKYTVFQTCVFAINVICFNFVDYLVSYLPTSIKNTSHDSNQFRSVLKSFLLINSFYSLEEYFAWNPNGDLGSV
jgi:hypothetical protein